MNTKIMSLKMTDSNSPNLRTKPDMTNVTNKK